LNVDAVAEGSAQRVGQAAGINVRLTHVASERQLWSQAYQRDLGDLLRLQSEVAHAIATPRGWDGGTGGVRGNTTRLSN
jgi:TolB-like protein